MRKVYLLKKLPSNLLKKCQYEEVMEFFKFSRRHEAERYFNEGAYYYVDIEDILTKMVPKETYEKNLKHADGRVLKKFRYKLPLVRAEEAYLDVYKGELEGVNLIRIRAYKKNNFRKLGWFGEDVTNDPTYSIYSLTHSKVADLKKQEEMER